ncbi:MAG: histidinol dehydrogenase [Pseudomonadota bacterium]
MPTFLNTKDAGFDLAFETFLNLKRDVEDDVDKAAAKIIADVRARGIDAVLELTERFDRLSLTPESVAFNATEISEAIATVSAEERTALELAAARIRSYHERQLPQDASWVDECGATLGWRWTAVEAAGLYVPGGLASYPSSVLMNAIPARVAGVERLIICAPTPDGATNPLVLLAAKLSGVSEIYRIGGAQAIAAMAYGADPISPVDKITGPGNAYVAAAKRRVFGQVGIDMIAGPSEVLVIADGESDPDWVALDLLAQAEHDANAQSILITDNRAFGQAVSDAVDRRLETLARREIARASWRDYGAIIEVGEISQACALSDQIAPEHLEIQTKDPEVIAAQVKHAGAIFLGAHTPEAIGDYVGGPNHVLPTSRSARFSSGLSVLDFMKRTTLASMTPAALKEVGPAAETLAKSESLEAHGLSVSVRLERLN